MAKKPVTAKMTMTKWEKSSMDDKADKGGRHGKEGSAKDMAADKKGVAAYNKKAGVAKGKKPNPFAKKSGNPFAKKK